MFKVKAIIAASVCTASIFTVSAAYAKSKYVSYNDLNLSTESGQKVLQNRIEIAARKVCEFDRPTTGSRLPDQDMRVCYHQAIAQTQARVASTIDASSANTPRLGG